MLQEVNYSLTMSCCQDETSEPSFGSYLPNLTPEMRKLPRKIERLTLKLSSARTAITFNQMCLREGLFPIIVVVVVVV